MHRKYLKVDCEKAILTINEFERLPEVHQRLPFAYDADTHSDYIYLLQQMYSSYIAPLLSQSRNYTYESPIVIIPKSLIVHMQCTGAEADLSLTLYNEDRYPIKILNFKGYDLVESWCGDGTKLCLNLIELVTNKLDISESYLLISFSVKNGFVISERVFLEYE